MTDELRAIEIDSYAKVAAPTRLGRPPRLEWLAIRDLVIDPAYQRVITPQGRKNVRRIVSTFDWSMFAPAVVAGAGGGKFAIVDGQHRVTAAALLGVDKVPCAIIDASRAGQAAAFRAINANVTRLQTVQIFHAAIAAGDEQSLRTAKVCRTAGVVVMRYPVPSFNLKPGETIAVGTIKLAIVRFGNDATIAALRAIVSTGRGNPGLLNKTVIWGAVEVLADHPEWWRAPAALHAAFDSIDLGEALRAANAAAARIKGTSSVDLFEARLVAALDGYFKGSKKPGGHGREA